MIDKVYVLNLDSQPHRWHTMMATLHMANVPFERIERVTAKDGRHYDNREQVLDDMVRDGFDAYIRFWRELPADSEITFWHEPKNLCVQWGHLSIIRRIAEKGETALVFEDDTYLRNHTLYGIEKRCEMLDDFEVLYLYSHDWYLVDKEHRISGYETDQTKFSQALVPTVVPEIFANSYGMGSQIRMWTPAGAERFLASRADQQNENWSYYLKVDEQNTSKHLVWKSSNHRIWGGIKNREEVSFCAWDSRFIQEWE